MSSPQAHDGRVLLLSNAGSGRSARRMARVDAALGARRELRHLVTRSREEATRALQELAQQPPEVLIINGGDGTAAHVFGEVLRLWEPEHRPLLMLLPGGTANMTAGDVGVRGSLPGALRRVRRWLERGGSLQGPGAGERLRRHVMRVRAGADGAPLYGMFLGGGTIIQGTDYAHAAVHARGLGGELSLGWSLARTLWGLLRQDPVFCQPVPLGLQLDAGGASAAAATTTTAATTSTTTTDVAAMPAPVPAQLFAASTLERLFLGIDPFWGEGPAPLRLTVVRVGAQRFLRTFQAILRGRGATRASVEAGYESYRSHSAALWLDGRLNLDGELLDVSLASGPVHITAEGPLEFMRL